MLVTATRLLPMRCPTVTYGISDRSPVSWKTRCDPAGKSKVRPAAATVPQHSFRRNVYFGPILISAKPVSCGMAGSRPWGALLRQTQIYLGGVSGRRPGVPIDSRRLEEGARRRLRPDAYAYIAAGAGNERTVLANRAA